MATNVIDKDEGEEIGQLGHSIQYWRQTNWLWFWRNSRQQLINCQLSPVVLFKTYFNCTVEKQTPLFWHFWYKSIDSIDWQWRSIADTVSLSPAIRMLTRHFVSQTRTANIRLRLCVPPAVMRCFATSVRLWCDVVGWFVTLMSKDLFRSCPRGMSAPKQSVSFVHTHTHADNISRQSSVDIYIAILH